MFETASAQPVGLFQSPALNALERLLARLNLRAGDLESQFLSRQQSFLDRVFSRHFEVIGLPTERSTFSSRDVEPVSLNLPHSWVPASRSSRVAQSPGATRAEASPAVTGAAARRVMGAVSPAERPGILPVVAPEPALTVGNAARQPDAASLLRGTPNTTAASTAQSILPAAARRQPDGSVSADTVAPLAAGRGPEMAAPEAAGDVLAEPGADLASQSAPILPRLQPPISSTESQPIGLPSQSDAIERSTGASAPVAETASASVEPSTELRVRDLLNASGIGTATVATVANRPSPRSSSAPQAEATDATLPATAARQPARASTVSSPPTPASPPTASLGKARSFLHLGWADSQLSRSPWWRAAALPNRLDQGGLAAAPSMAPAMPVVQTPDLAPMARRAGTAFATGSAALQRPTPPLAKERPTALSQVPTPSAASVHVAPAEAAHASPDALLQPATAPSAAVGETATRTQAVQALRPQALEALDQAVRSVEPPTEAGTTAPQPEVLASHLSAASPVSAAVAASSMTADVAPALAGFPAQAAESRRASTLPQPQVPHAGLHAGMGEAVRLDPGLLPAHASPELVQLLSGNRAPQVTRTSTGASTGASTGGPMGVSWGQPGGLWTQPAWSSAGILTRLAQRSLISQVDRWQSAPGVPTPLARSLAGAEAGRTLQHPAPRELPWVAPPVVARNAPPLASAADSSRSQQASPSRERLTAAASRGVQLAPAYSAVAGVELGRDTTAMPQAQPWREPGGLGALAELFAAGIGIGSGAAATLAQHDAGAAVPSLLADWIRPNLTRAVPLPATVSYGVDAPSRVSTAVLPWLSAPRSDSPTPQAHSPQTQASRPVREQPESATGRPAAVTAAQPTMSMAAPAVGHAPDQIQEHSVASLPSGQPAIATPAAGYRASPALPALQLGSIGFLAQRFAGEQGLRAVSRGLPLHSDAQTWAAAPGLSTALSQNLRQIAGPAASVNGRVTTQMPYLDVLPQRRASGSGVSLAPSGLSPREAASAPASARADRAAAVSPLVPLAPTAARVETAASQAAAVPWFSPGGGGTLAELFAADIGMTSGATAWLGQLATGSSGGVVPSWVSALLSGVPAPQSVSDAQPGVAGPAQRRPVWSASLPWIQPPRADVALAPGLVRSATKDSANTYPALTAALPAAGRTSVRAEQFASQQGLSGAAGDAGRYQPVAGGLVFLPSPQAGSVASESIARPKATAIPMGTVSRPGSPLAFATGLGGLGLRSELFARAEQARMLGAGELISQSLGVAERLNPAMDEGLVPTTSAGSLRGAGGLVYLPRPANEAATSAAQSPRLSTVVPPSAAKQAARQVHVSPLNLAQPWPTLPRELGRLGLSSLALPKAQPSESAAVAPTAMRSPLPMVSATPPAAPRLPVGSLPVLGGSSLKAAPEAQPHRATTAPRQPYELAARFASSMLTAFPQPERPATASAVSEGAKPAMLWPQTASATGERVQRLLAMLPAVVPSMAPLAALSELVKTSAAGSGVGMPLWQRLPSSPALSLFAGTKAAERSPEDSLDDAEDDDETSRPSLTLVSGDQPGNARSRRAVPTPSVSTAKPAAPPPVEVFKAALSASGISREQVEASAKLMQAIGGASGGSSGRSDDRLSLDDLTLVAISMGQGRMAASQNTSLTSIPSVESALRLPSVQHPTVSQDDKDVRKKIDTMADSVIKMIKQMKDNQAIRGGFDM
ncbi:MAG: hypothetical protein JNJ46_02660 [Myxococcales bacterium]|nr:hypothetical protein [Myxococcales bacterium]